MAVDDAPTTVKVHDTEMNCRGGRVPRLIGQACECPVQSSDIRTPDAPVTLIVHRISIIRFK